MLAERARLEFVLVGGLLLVAYFAHLIFELESNLLWKPTVLRGVGANIAQAAYSREVVGLEHVFFLCRGSAFRRSLHMTMKIRDLPEDAKLVQNVDPILASKKRTPKWGPLCCHNRN